MSATSPQTFLNTFHCLFLSLQGIARLQRHEQIVDEVKLALKPFFKHGEINKDDYKLIMRKSVEKVCGIVFFSADPPWYHSRGFFHFFYRWTVSG